MNPVARLPAFVFAIGLAAVGSIVALVNEALSYRRGEALDWGHIALAIGVPAIMYAIFRKGSRKPS